MPRRLPRPQVRCCSDTQLSYAGWLKNAGCSVWGGSDEGLGCKRDQTFAQAEAICDGFRGARLRPEPDFPAPGARLCTVAELEGGCTDGTGCGFNDDLIWAVPTPSASPVG